MAELLLKNIFELLAAAMAITGVRWIRFAYRGENFRPIENSIDYFLLIQGLAIGTFSCVGVGILCVRQNALGEWTWSIVGLLVLGVLLILHVLNLGVSGFFARRRAAQYGFRALPLVLMMLKLFLDHRLEVNGSHETTAPNHDASQNRVRFTASFEKPTIKSLVFQEYRFSTTN